jgi:hypothetical protein
MAKLEDSQTGKVIELTQHHYSIGRSEDNMIRFQETSVSRHHAELTRKPHGWEITDLGSTCGTFVNKTKITSSTILRDGDSITLGMVQLTFYDPDFSNLLTREITIPERESLIARLDDTNDSHHYVNYELIKTRRPFSAYVGFVGLAMIVVGSIWILVLLFMSRPGTINDFLVPVLISLLGIVIWMISARQHFIKILLLSLLSLLTLASIILIFANIEYHQENQVLGIVIAILDLCIVFWWFLGRKEDHCDWCKEPFFIRRYKYYELRRDEGRTEDNIMFCSLKCQKAYGRKEKTWRLIHGDN